MTRAAATATTVTITHQPEFELYTLKVAENGRTLDLATAHRVGVPDDMWSVKLGDRVLGLAPGRAVAVAELEKLAAMARRA
jgi:hypothetical protein